MFARYPFFYTQLFCSMTGTIVVQVAYSNYFPGAKYAVWYWPAELITMAIASTLFLDVMRYTLDNCAATRRVAAGMRLLLGLAILAMASLRFFLSSAQLAGTLCERGFRLFEALFLVAIIILAIRSRLPIGGNIRGIIAGYGIIVAINLIFFAVAFYAGYPPLRRWNWVPGAGYDIAFIIWLISLWRHYPNPALEMPPHGLGAGEMSRTYLTREAQA